MKAGFQVKGKLIKNRPAARAITEAKKRNWPGDRKTAYETPVTPPNLKTETQQGTRRPLGGFAVCGS